MIFHHFKLFPHAVNSFRTTTGFQQMTHWALPKRSINSLCCCTMRIKRSPLSTPGFIFFDGWTSLYLHMVNRRLKSRPRSSPTAPSYSALQSEPAPASGDRTTPQILLPTHGTANEWCFNASEIDLSTNYRFQPRGIHLLGDISQTVQWIRMIFWLKQFQTTI